MYIVWKCSNSSNKIELKQSIHVFGLLMRIRDPTRACFNVSRARLREVFTGSFTREHKTPTIRSQRSLLRRTFSIRIEREVGSSEGFPGEAETLTVGGRVGWREYG